MFSANRFAIRQAAADEPPVRALARLDSRKPLRGRILLGEIDGVPAAALSIDDGRVVADPFRLTDPLVAALRQRAGVLVAVEATPSVRDRLIARLALGQRRRSASPA